MTNIDPKDISVVVQGAVAKELTKQCIENIKKYLPGAEIILSTWKNQDLNDLSYDILIENDDPGAVIRNDFLKIPNNLNRQLVTTQAGIFKATRKYVLKIRTDLLLHSDDFLNYFDKFPKRVSNWSFLKKRVLIVDIFTRNPNILRPYPFCPSDWIYFGLKEDIMTIWNIPLVEEPAFSRWFDSNPRPDLDYYPDEKCIFASEQYIWISFLKKFREINCCHTWDMSGDNAQETDMSFVNNAIIVDANKWKITNKKYKNIRTVDRVSFYSHHQWKELYKKYCDPDYSLLPDLSTLYKKWLLKSGKIKGTDIKTLQERKRLNDLHWDIKQLKNLLEKNQV